MISNLAYIHPDAKIGNNVTVEPFAYIAGDVVIGDGCWIGPGAVIHDGARIGKGLRLSIVSFILFSVYACFCLRLPAVCPGLSGASAYLKSSHSRADLISLKP